MPLPKLSPLPPESSGVVVLPTGVNLLYLHPENYNAEAYTPAPSHRYDLHTHHNGPTMWYRRISDSGRHAKRDFHYYLALHQPAIVLKYSGEVCCLLSEWDRQFYPSHTAETKADSISQCQQYCPPTTSANRAFCLHSYGLISSHVSNTDLHPRTSL